MPEGVITTFLQLSGMNPVGAENGIFGVPRPFPPKVPPFTQKSLFIMWLII
ncbi:hypothetical protein CSC18_4878 [Klebsiella aerogenes]|uniref:hypothetical protein n=1 Tax=Enterococcus faecalis TaxID=1351 RepID=UPI000AC97135|nr:hypothetical protein CSC18_4878 [Klebsiella aerogenes]